MQFKQNKQDPVSIEFQYFNGCPNSNEMKRRVTIAIQQSKIPVNYREVLVETEEKAQQIKFRGSPTVLINGRDFEDLPEPEIGNLACRFYPNGLPDVDFIVKLVQKANN